MTIQAAAGSAATAYSSTSAQAGKVAAIAAKQAGATSQDAAKAAAKAAAEAARSTINKKTVGYILSMQSLFKEIHTVHEL